MSAIEDVIKFLIEQKLTLTTAESCTAGMVTSLLANVPGCGLILDLGFVVYTEHAKHCCLGVDLQTIQAFGLTSEEVAKEMALGALSCSQANLAIAITGTAESNDDLNGVVCFAYALRMESYNRSLSETVTFKGGRNQVRYLAAMHVITSIPTYHKKLCASEEEFSEQKNYCYTYKPPRTHY